MPISILFVTATSREADILRKIAVPDESGKKLISGNCIFEPLVTGVGSIATAWATTHWFSLNPKPDLAINSGIAGSFREEIKVGEVVLPISDRFADAGVEADEGFLTLAEAGLEDPDRFPFTAGKITAGNRFIDRAAERMRTVEAISVNTVTGSLSTRQRLVSRYGPDVETMEGAAFFYVCKRADVPFMAFRSISNMVEARDKSRWNIPLALENLAAELQHFILNIR
ncbi:MAG: futalosine hydrolase [Bacteroidales bacterium]|nr:futalosine hydrolase [Bacteroidales bacterium]